MKPLKSRIEVFQIGAEDRVYEGVTDDVYGLSNREATQLSGPKLPITVSESRFKFWGGGGPEPTTFSRKHNVYYQPEGAKWPVPLHEVRTRAEIDTFRKYGDPGELIFFIPVTGIT